MRIYFEKKNVCTESRLGFWVALLGTLNIQQYYMRTELSWKITSLISPERLCKWTKLITFLQQKLTIT